MQFRTDEQLRKYLTKKVQGDIGGCRGWTFNGMQFTNSASYFDGEFNTWVGYVCDFKTLAVTISQTYGGLSNGYGVITEKVFTCGENAISECIAWVVDKLIEIYKLLNERTAPYTLGKDLYQQALNRPIHLQEG